MERAIAIKKLGKLLGKKLGYRIDHKAATPEEKAAAKIEMVQAVKERDELQQKKRQRYDAIIAADEEYQTLKAAYETAKKRTDKLFSIAHHDKFTVGTNEGFFFLVKASGNSWEEVIDKVMKKEGA